MSGTLTLWGKYLKSINLTKKKFTLLFFYFYTFSSTTKHLDQNNLILKFRYFINIIYDLTLLIFYWQNHDKKKLKLPRMYRKHKCLKLINFSNAQNYKRTI